MRLPPLLKVLRIETDEFSLSQASNWIRRASMCRCRGHHQLHIE